MKKRNVVKEVFRSIRISESLKRNGFDLDIAEHLTNVRWIYRGHGAELGDATIVRRWEIKGKKTYDVREILKTHGFRWDPKFKVWYKKGLLNTATLGSEILRAIAKR